MRPRARSSRRGSAVIEFALSAAVLIPCMAGTFQFGYGLYSYNRLQSAVDEGGRYAALRTYRTSAGATDTDKVKLAIKNVVVYGTPSPANGAVPMVNGLGTGNVSVTYDAAVPSTVTVSISSFTVNTIFTSYTFAGKPFVTYPFLGRYAPSESEP